MTLINSYQMILRQMNQLNQDQRNVHYHLKRKSYPKNQTKDILLDRAIARMEGAQKSNTRQEKKMDEFDVFGKHVAHEIQAITSAHMQRWVKWNIQTTLYNTHMNHPSTVPMYDSISPNYSGSPHSSIYQPLEYQKQSLSPLSRSSENSFH